MKVKPMLGDYEVPGIERIGSTEARRLVETAVPGLEGSYVQDLGSSPVSVRIDGTLAGDDARDGFLDSVRQLFNAGEPVDFVADITTATAVDTVVVSSLRVGEVAGSADSFRYSIVLTQHVEPPPSGPGADLGFGDLAAVADLQAALDEVAQGMFDGLQVPDMIAGLPDLKDPTPPLAAVLGPVKAAMGNLSGLGDQLSELFGP